MKIDSGKVTKFNDTYLEIIIAAILGLVFGVFVNPQTGILITSIDLLLWKVRIQIFKHYTTEFENFSEVYKIKQTIMKIEDTDFIKEANSAENKFITEFKKISEGTFTYYNFEDYLEAATKQIDETKSYMKATAFVDFDQWKKNGELSKYLDKQIQAKKKNKNLTIIRIFLLDEEEINYETAEVLRAQILGKIEVFIAKRHYRTISDMPFVIYDGKVTMSGTKLESGKITKGMKTINRDEINTYSSIFAEIRILAKKVEINDKGDMLVDSKAIQFS